MNSTALLLQPSDFLTVPLPAVANYQQPLGWNPDEDFSLLFDSNFEPLQGIAYPTTENGVFQLNISGMDFGSFPDSRPLQVSMGTEQLQQYEQYNQQNNIVQSFMMMNGLQNGESTSYSNGDGAFQNDASTSYANGASYANGSGSFGESSNSFASLAGPPSTQSTTLDWNQSFGEFASFIQEPQYQAEQAPTPTNEVYEQPPTSVAPHSLQLPTQPTGVAPQALQLPAPPQHQPYVPPAGAAYSSQRKVGGRWQPPVAPTPEPETPRMTAAAGMPY
ncbi:hypothetical protein M422DRAFT_56828 [Sphaerobolus stellatus SS14]|uniref:Uncharacterized protein n=1 Tax=Sphaerobolus stellatus (strain SS14) TaxID=990650 RepID=A0A0C9T3K9_SPHS4|nr:hypothetical protein M422DRAFT_56828 [Sphaerobolus stellatus SS14]